METAEDVAVLADLLEDEALASWAREGTEPGCGIDEITLAASAIARVQGHPDPRARAICERMRRRVKLTWVDRACGVLRLGADLSPMDQVAWWSTRGHYVTMGAVRYYHPILPANVLIPLFKPARYVDMASTVAEAVREARPDVPQHALTELLHWAWDAWWNANRVELRYCRVIASYERRRIGGVLDELESMWRVERDWTAEWVGSETQRLHHRLIFTKAELQTLFADDSDLNL